MNRYLVSLIIILVALLSVPHEADARGSIIDVFLDGKKLHFTNNPVIENGTTLVEIRSIFTALDMNLKYDSTTKTIAGENEDISLFLQLNNRYAYVNFHKHALTRPAYATNGRTIVPLRFISEATGANVKWEQATNSIYINTENATRNIPSSKYKVTGDILNMNFTEVEIFLLTNEERHRQGVAPFRLDVNMSQVARIKSKDMHDQQYFSHTSPTHGSPFEMMRNHGITYYSRMGENIAAGQHSAQHVTTSWINSPGHHHNMISTTFDSIGIGYHQGSRGYNRYYTQMFGG
ncbi:stalk domain-containing protein [Bacillus sp. FJAT-45037]|uniref:stalk domain-containing protein n=1 Tax=Bacillus sp. FJAT-45037 TaxID=2011007 RepID=UPI000C23BFDB|nr:stalk domain-containing protein [Bacillus sp. FJAT-45037]